MNFHARQKLFESVIQTHSYYLGYQEFCISIDFFRKVFLTFHKSLVTNPSNRFNIYQSKAGFGQKSYVDKIQESYPTLLHKLYQYAISVLGASSSTRAIVSVMNRKARVTIPEDTIASTIALKTYHFWVFFMVIMANLNLYISIVKHETIQVYEQTQCPIIYV